LRDFCGKKSAAIPQKSRNEAGSTAPPGYAFYSFKYFINDSNSGLVSNGFTSFDTLPHFAASHTYKLATISISSVSIKPTGIQQYGIPLNSFGTGEPQEEQKCEVNPESLIHLLILL
jgi:hypothetical protein